MISGFETDIAILLLAACVIFSFGIGWWSYSGMNQLPTAVRWLNTVLRSAAILLLIILLFNPAYERDEVRQLKQNIAVLLDNSQSTTIEKGAWEGEPAYRNLIDALELSDTTNIRYHVFGLDRDLFSTSPDSLPLDGTVTDINRSITSLMQSESDPDAVIMVTDGIFNRGLDPTTTAIRSGLPFYNIAIGDTSRLRDVLVRNVYYNPEAFTRSTVPIRAEIVNDGFPDRTIEVRLYEGNNLLETRNIRTESSRSVHTEEFELTFTEEGSKSLRIEVPEIGEEWTTANNRYSFTIDVKDDQIRILHLAFEIHPDVGNFRNVLATDESISLSGLNWLGGNRFGGGELPATADTLDLLILHGYPSGQIPESLAEQINDFAASTNILLLSLPGTRFDRLSAQLSNLAPIRQTSSTPLGNILPVIAAEQRDHPILDIEIPAFDRAPELGGPRLNQQTASNARTLLNTTFRGSETGAPMLVIQELGNTRISQLNAHHWYRWQQHPNNEYREFYRDLMNNLVKWTSADPGDDIVRVQPVRPTFDEGEPVTFRGNVRTETGAPDPDARVDLTITDSEGNRQDFSMRSLGSGQFRLETRNQPAGTYTYEAEAYRGNTLIGTSGGSFTVTESMLEFMDTVRRDGLLQFISENSDGAFFTHENAGELRNRLSADGFLDRRTETYTTVTRIHHQLWWFVLALLLFTVEWILRKAYDLA